MAPRDLTLEAYGFFRRQLGNVLGPGVVNNTDHHLLPTCYPQLLFLSLLRLKAVFEVSCQQPHFIGEDWKLRMLHDQLSFTQSKLVAKPGFEPRWCDSESRLLCNISAACCTLPPWKLEPSVSSRTYMTPRLGPQKTLAQLSSVISLGSTCVAALAPTPIHSLPGGLFFMSAATRWMQMEAESWLS